MIFKLISIYKNIKIYLKEQYCMLRDKLLFEKK